MTTSGERGLTPDSSPPPRPTCPLCRAILAHDHEDDPDGLCSPCRGLVTKCLPFSGHATQAAPDEICGQAPEGVNVLELAAGILLTHGALHPGESCDLRAALSTYGVDLDNVEAQNIVRKLRRRHGMVVEGTPLPDTWPRCQPGYTLVDWHYEARRVRSSLRTG